MEENNPKIYKGKVSLLLRFLVAVLVAVVSYVLMIWATYYYDISHSKPEASTSGEQKLLAHTDCAVTSLSSTMFRGYTIELSSYDDTFETNCSRFAQIRIFKEDKVFFEGRDAYIYPGLGSQSDENEQAECLMYRKCDAELFLKQALRDVDNDGIPELVFSYESDGSGQYGYANILSLDNDYKLLYEGFTIRQNIRLEDLNKDGLLEIITGDSSLHEWHTPNCCSIYPTLIYSIKNGEYSLDTDLMSKPAPPERDLQVMASKFNLADWGDENDPPPKEIDGEWATPWSYALELIYSGNAVTARKYIDLVWVPNKAFASKEVFIDELSKEITIGKDFPVFFNLEALKNTK